MASWISVVLLFIANYILTCINNRVESLCLNGVHSVEESGYRLSHEAISKCPSSVA